MKLSKKQVSKNGKKTKKNSKMIHVTLEKQSENTELFESLDPKYKSFESDFKNGKNLFKFHTFIIFPKCEKLSHLSVDECGKYLVDENIDFSIFMSFIKLLYGKTIEMTFIEVLEVFKIIKLFEYDERIIKNLILDNVNTLSYTSDNNQMTHLMDILLSSEFTYQEIIEKCKMSQLKRVLLMTSDPEILRIIAFQFLTNYSKDTKEIKNYYEKEKLKLIGKYETTLNSEKTSSKYFNPYKSALQEYEEEAFKYYTK